MACVPVDTHYLWNLSIECIDYTLHISYSSNDDLENTECYLKVSRVAYKMYIYFLKNC